MASSGRTDDLQYVAMDSNGNFVDSVQSANNVYAVDGAISTKTQTAFLTKGSAGAYTLAAPATVMNGMTIRIVGITAFAHVVTGAFNAAGTTLTLAAVAGSTATVTAYNGRWYTPGALAANHGTVA
jgi:hypothetical protein